MSASSAGGNIGNGIRVGFATGSSPWTFHRIEGIRDCTPPKITYDKVDSNVSKDSNFKTNIPGLANVSDVVIKMKRDPDPATSPYQNQLLDLLNAKTPVHIRVEIPADPDRTVNSFSAYEFDGRVSTFEEMAPLAALQEVQSAIVFSGVYLQHQAPMGSLL